MTPIQLTKQDSGKFALTGALKFDTVPALHQQFAQLVPKANSLTLDLSGVSYCDSSGVALMLECIRLSRKAKKTLQFLHIPAQMQAIARVSGVADLLADHSVNE
jgi:anti-anti-sigma factor